MHRPSGLQLKLVFVGDQGVIQKHRDKEENGSLTLSLCMRVCARANGNREYTRGKRNYGGDEEEATVKRGWKVAPFQRYINARGKPREDERAAARQLQQRESV